MSASRILVVDDDSDIRVLVRRLLEGAGYAIAEAADGRDGLRLLHGWRPDVVLLDVSMPALDGWEVLERIRELSDELPVMMLTAVDSELQKVRALRGGADDYITKPFGRQELVARVEALLRRTRSARTEDVAVYEDERIRVDFAQRLVARDGLEIRLTPTEFKLLAALVRHRGQILSHDQLLELTWGDAGRSRDQLKLYVGYVRRKLGVADLIESVRGFGYRYVSGAA